MVAILAVTGLAIAGVLIAGSVSSDTGKGTGNGKKGTAANAPAPGAVNAEPQRPSRAPVPILMYHVISTAQPGTPDPELYVNQGNLEREMSWLADHGYSGVTLDRVYRAWFKGDDLPQKPVVVSFDDGYRSQYTDALPVMRKFGWPGVLNLKVDTLTQGELTDDQVKAMMDAGWEIDSHTITHADVTQIGGADLEREVGGSRRILQKRFGIPVNFFCYPAGQFDAESEQAVKDAGYLGATTVEEGLADRHEMYTLKRVRVDGSDGVKGLAEKLSASGA